MRRTNGFLALVVLAATPALCGAATIRVDPDAGGDFTEIQPAIDAAIDGDEIVVRPGAYELCAPLTFLGKAIVVRSETGAEETVISMCDSPTELDRASVVVFESGPYLSPERVQAHEHNWNDDR